MNKIYNFLSSAFVIDIVEYACGYHQKSNSKEAGQQSADKSATLYKNLATNARVFSSKGNILFTTQYFCAVKRLLVDECNDACETYTKTSAENRDEYPVSTKWETKGNNSGRKTGGNHNWSSIVIFAIISPNIGK